jgi:enterochelin esterase-like enzyme
VNNTQLFSHLGVLSSGWLPNQKEISDAQYDFMKKNTGMINGNLKLFWIAMGGKEDIAYNNCQAMLAKFNEIGVKHVYTEYPGGHTWPVWRNNLYTMAPLLFR